MKKIKPRSHESPIHCSLFSHSLHPTPYTLPQGKHKSSRRFPKPKNPKSL
ncbi:MAG: hypothetical protein F6J93_22985 [Oscillatoria sp. SIO1A7]|nr:hypothetical protein [Oscillatoria sp. SIO1A7]